MVLPRVYLWAWESDVLAVDQSYQVTEFEIKTDRADFNNDREKSFGSLSKDALLDEQTFGPNFFYYVVSAKVYRKVFKALPDHAGLMVARKDGRLETVKKAPELHGNPISSHRLNELYRKGYQRYRQAEIDNRELQDRIRLMNRHFAEERKTWEADRKYQLKQTIRRQQDLIRDLYAAIEALKSGNPEDVFIQKHIDRAGQYLAESKEPSTGKPKSAAVS